MIGSKSEMDHANSRTALVIGATGGFGAETARALSARGWRVRALHRAPETVALPHLPTSTEWRRGDAMVAADIAKAADGADLVVHAANPPGYRNWRKLALPMLDNAVAAAAANGARLLMPGNVYNFGPDAWPEICEDSSQNPVSRKGAVRVEMERRIAEAVASGRLRAMILRAGDYFGPHAPASWVSNAMIRPGRPARSILWPGDRTTGHAFAYLPDVAEAAARLIEAQDRLADFETVNFAGHWVEPGIAFAEALARASGHPGARVKHLPWPLVRLAAPFAPTLRETLEMRYLWREPVRLDNAKLRSLIGPEPHTPLDAALRETLAGLGCLGEAAPARRTTAAD